MGHAITCALAVSLMAGHASGAYGQTRGPKPDDLKARIETAIDGAVKKAGNPPFNSFYWVYDYDGTDASLHGIADQPGRFPETKRPKIHIAFDCSKQWIRLVMKPSNIGRYPHTPLLGSSIGDDIDIIFDGTDPAIIVSTLDTPKRNVVRSVSKITKYFHDAGMKEIGLKFGGGAVSFDIAPSTPSLIETRQAIVSFREKCSSWWSDF